MRTLLILSSLVLLFGCRSIIPPVVLTEDKVGRSLTMATIPESGPRSDTPAGVAPRNVASEVQTPFYDVITVKEPFRKPRSYVRKNTNYKFSMDIEQVKKDLATDYFDKAGVELCKNVIRGLVDEIDKIKNIPPKIVRPKDPWWKWPLIVGIALGIGLVAFFLRQIKDFVFFRKR